VNGGFPEKAPLAVGAVKTSHGISKGLFAVANEKKICLRKISEWK
jgi:hypothetical protein